jgi:hypothetical protein
MAEQFDFLIANDSEHEELFIEIYYQGKFVALINQELGLNNLQIELPGAELDESETIKRLPLNEFLDLIEQAAKKLQTG